MKRVVALVAALSIATALGQYYPYGYPFYPTADPWYGYPSDPYGYQGFGYQYPGYGYGTGGHGLGWYGMGGTDYLGQVGNILSELQAQQAYYMGQMDASIRATQAELDKINRYFIDLYRQTTGDVTSPDSYALEAGKLIHCQRNPVDCQLAYENSKASLAARQASFDSWLAGVRERDAANDAAFASWMQNQDYQQSQHSAYVRGAILGLSEYGDPTSNTSYYLPYAPSQESYYQTPTGLPLVFDQARGIWYQVEPNGTYTPYYEVR